MFYETSKDDHGLSRPPFKSIAVPRPIGWISTLSKSGVPNLAPFSQFTNLGFNPPYVLISCNVNANGSRKDTVVNIEETGEFVHNMATYDLREAVSLCGAAFAPEIDEFEKAGLTKAPSVLVKPYRVAESPVQMECVHVQTIRLPGNGPMGSVDVIIGKVVGIHIKDDCITADGKIDIEKIKPLARLGYTDYACIDHIFSIAPSTAAGAHSSFGMDGGSSNRKK